MYFLFAKLLSLISSRGIELPIQVRKRFEQLYLICVVSSSGKQILILVPRQEMKPIMRLLWPGNMYFLSDKSRTLWERDSKFVADSFGSLHLDIRNALA